MLFFFTVFIKRPRYALAFIPLLLLLIIGSLQGNGFASLMTFIFSCICWCCVSLNYYISDKSVDTKFLGIDLKTYTSGSSVVLLFQGALLLLSWVPLLITQISLRNLPSFLGFVFISNFLIIFLGIGLLLASLAIKVSRTDAKLDKSTADHLFECLKKLLSQP